MSINLKDNMKRDNMQEFSRLFTYVSRLDNRYVLTGAMAIKLAYGGNREANRFEIDSYGDNLLELLRMYCSINNFKVDKIGNDGIKVKYIVQYGVNGVFEIEAREKKKWSSEKEVAVVKRNGLTVYSPNETIKQKRELMNIRQSLELLYDITFIAVNNWGELNEDGKAIIREIVASRQKIMEYIINYNKKTEINKHDITLNITILENKFWNGRS